MKIICNTCAKKNITRSLCAKSEVLNKTFVLRFSGVVVSKITNLVYAWCRGRNKKNIVSVVVSQ